MTKAMSDKKRNILLILLCAVVYLSTYLLKYTYNANVTKLEEVYSVTHAESGLVSTMFFIAYGVGQIINGLLVRKYPLKYIVTGSILLSCILNVLLVTSTSFIPFKYYWFINGFSLSTLWPSMIRVVGEYVDETHKNKAAFFMSMTTPLGMVIVYGLSALFIELNCYQVVFYIGIGLAFVLALLWFFAFDSLKSDSINEAKEEPIKDGQNTKTNNHIYFVIVIAILSITVSLVKDGLTMWFPLVLKEKYSYGDSISVLLTMGMPLVSLFGSAIAIKTSKWVNNYVLQSAIFFSIALVLVGLNSIFNFTSAIYIIIAFPLSALFLSCVTNITTSLIPICWKDPKKSGLFAGIFNGCCYIGSAISSYGLGVLADNLGWDQTLWILVFILLGSAILGFLFQPFIAIANSRKKRNIAKQNTDK